MKSIHRCRIFILLIHIYNNLRKHAAFVEVFCHSDKMTGIDKEEDCIYRACKKLRFEPTTVK